MLFPLIATAFAALSVLPILLTIDLHHADRTLARLQLSCIRLHRQWILELVRTPSGHRLLTMSQGHTPQEVKPAQLHNSTADQLLSVIRRADHARRFLLRHITPELFDVALLLHTESAASTALLTGTANLLQGFIPSRWRRITHLRIQPDFFSSHSTLQARSIIRFRLGTIIITAGMLLASYVIQHAIKAREATKWNTPLEN